MHIEAVYRPIRSMLRRRPRLHPALCAAVIAALLGPMLAACAQTPAANAVPPGAKPGNLTLEACTYKIGGTKYVADCGMLVVPENRADPASRLISVPVVRVLAAADQSSEPIFFLNGGPGQSNLTFEPPLGLLSNHDFVLVGYRGVDGSVRLDCAEVSQALQNTGGDLLSVASRARLSSAAADCAQRWQASGVDLAGYSMPEVIADLEMARAALGYARIHLLSESYGTRVAQLYAYLHPDRIYRSAMLAVNPPGRFVWEPGMTDQQLEDYARLCAQEADCRARSPDLAETMRQVVEHMPKRWLFVPIDPGKVKVMSFMGLFHRDMAATVFDAYQAAAEGDASGLALMSLAWDLLAPSIQVWGDVFAKAGTADFDPARDYAADLDPAGSILGSPMSLLYFDHMGWPVTPLPAELRRVQPSDVETLLVSGSVDFSTPAQYATDELLPALRHGQQVIVAEAGHTGDLFGLQPAATERLLTSFYDTGVADASRFTYMPMDFHVGLGFPLLAKLLAATALLLITVPATGLAWVLRWKRRRLGRRQPPAGDRRPAAEGASAQPIS